LTLCLWCVGSGDKAKSFQHIQECHLSLPHIIAPTARERRIGTPTMASSYLVFAPTAAREWTVISMSELKACPYDAQSIQDCQVCMSDAPHAYCCKLECREHEFCRGCTWSRTSGESEGKRMSRNSTAAQRWKARAAHEAYIHRTPIWRRTGERGEG
jgi:hypothetical protein